MLQPRTLSLPDCPKFLSKDQLEIYWEQGYLAFENALRREEVDEAEAAISELVERYAFNDGICEMRPGKPGHTNNSGAKFSSRVSPFFFLVEPGYRPDPSRKEELEMNLRKLFSYANEAPIFRRLTCSHPKIKGIRDSILGPGSVLYQTMALIKPPYIGVEKPWHQDNAYFRTGNLDGVFGIWIALDDSKVENGCMHVIPGGHKLGPLRHHRTFDCEIVPGRLDHTTAVPVELKADGALIFHSNLPHETPPNHSPHRRRALQFHYRAADNHLIDHGAYDRVFREADGTPATCHAALRKNF